LATPNENAIYTGDCFQLSFLKKLPRTAIIMKLLSIFTLAATLVVGTLASVPHHTAAAWKVRGGATLGRLDAQLALDLSKTITAAYVAGSASKLINRQTGGQDTPVSLSAKFWSSRLVSCCFLLLRTRQKGQLTRTLRLLVVG
jgi:hypothetical protein